MNSQLRSYAPFVGPFDPCPPILCRTYVIPPNQYVNFQPLDWPQYNLSEALRRGTLWPALYSPYTAKQSQGGDCC